MLTLVVEGAHARVTLDKELVRTAVGSAKRLEVQQINTKEILLLGKDAQQQVLAPLKADWDSLEPDRRQKWIAIAKRYPRMKAVEQERVQRRMQTWATLSPEQRRQARENYKHLAKSPRPAPNKDLRQAWVEYQSLSPYERQSLVPPTSTDPRRPKR